MNLCIWSVSFRLLMRICVLPRHASIRSDGILQWKYVGKMRALIFSKSNMHVFLYACQWTRKYVRGSVQIYECALQVVVKTNKIILDVSVSVSKVCAWWAHFSPVCLYLVHRGYKVEFATFYWSHSTRWCNRTGQSNLASSHNGYFVRITPVALCVSPTVRWTVLD